MRLLDLFCCCGGISKGFHNAGFECTGVDINNNHNYLYEFIHKDVFDLDIEWLKQFDIIHASPPCQYYSWAVHKDHRDNFPDLINLTRELLNKTGKPYVIENVIGAPLRKDLVLCGEMFGLRVVRHRLFEIKGFTILQPEHKKHKPNFINQNGKKRSYYAEVAGHGGESYSFKLEDWQNAIGIDWVSDKTHLTQMIPPKYAEYIGMQLLPSIS